MSFFEFEKVIFAALFGTRISWISRINAFQKDSNSLIINRLEMQFQKLILFAAVLFSLASCDTRPTVEAITKDGKVILSDGTEREIPMFSDTSAVIIYAVRHAEKDKGDDPSLTEAGRARAEKLALIFKDARIDRLLVSDKKRTKETLKRVKETLDPPIETIPVATLPTVVDIEILIEDHGHKLLMAHHSNSVPLLMNILLGQGKKYADIDDKDYGNFYIISTKGKKQTEILELRY